VISAVEQLHPVVAHHIVNTLGWPALRPLQNAAVAPIIAGDDALLLAPTAGGKTEAAIFPVLSAMAAQRWAGLSVLYVCPLRALLNNLEPRLAAYASWLGRRAALWHGDTRDATRRRLLMDRPDFLLTTPESLEATLVSTRVTPREYFADVRVVIVDEVHAFAGDDRGWHLLAVLERIQRLAGRPLQRIGLSATVGNPAQLLEWLQGSNAGARPARVVDPSSAPLRSASSADVTVDYVGTLVNAGKVISSLHHGEKRLVFCESRRKVEELAVDLRDRGVSTFVSHSSLSVDERRRAEQAFAEARDCVIVSTSTLELGIDVGDLDRVIQVDAPRTVASFLQRLGRTGRRPGAGRNALFLSTDQDSLLLAAGLLQLWGQSWVEPVTAPSTPRHLVAQQLLALCLQGGRVGDAEWTQWWNGLPMFDESAPDIVRWLVETGHLETDSGMLFIGAEAERRFGRRHFMELLSVFTAKPEFTVLHGRTEIGSVDPMQLTCKLDGPRVIMLAGRPWQVNHMDWKRHRCYVEPSDARGRMRWFSPPLPLTFAMCQARREVLLGADPPVRLTGRATDGLASLRADREGHVADDRSIVERRGGDTWWWTWAGARANATLTAALRTVVEPAARYYNDAVRLRSDVTPADLDQAVRLLRTNELPEPAVDDRAIRGLKFAEVLPPELAHATLAERIADPRSAAAVLAQPRRWH
jgi:ATP-dependent helicase Lhr and Lhr-like helicase